MHPKDLIAKQATPGFQGSQGMAGALVGGGPYRESTPRERAQLAVEQAKQRLADAERVMAIFDEHPELEELLTLLSRHGNF